MDKQQLAQMKHKFLDLQTHLCQTLENIDDSSSFQTDTWQRNEGGGGVSRVLEQGGVFEQAGVNFSHVFGDALPASASAQRPEIAGAAFDAMGVSLVIHPKNPYVPTTHANIRVFVAYPKDQAPIWWFGGGFDLTPFYPFAVDCTHWHQVAKQVCDDFDADLYPELKDWCDRYFYLKHRQETRGIGGLFFDDFNRWSPQRCEQFTFAVGNAFLKAYVPIVIKRKDIDFGERERAFQLYRRGRYVEFNLLFDRGTLFGIQSGGRTEAILMSMPPLARWQYNWQPDNPSAEAKLNAFLKPRDWLLETCI